VKTLDAIILYQSTVVIGFV